MRYNKADINSSIKAAMKVAIKHDKCFYVYATAYGYIVTTIKPPISQYYYLTNGYDVIHAGLSTK